MGKNSEMCEASYFISGACVLAKIINGANLSKFIVHVEMT
jgi:hypothetical protein